MSIPLLYTFKSLSGPFVSSFPFNFYCFLSRPLSSDNLSSIRVPIDPRLPSSCYCPFSFTFSRRRAISTGVATSSFDLFSLSLSLSLRVFLFLSLLMSERSFPISRFAPPSISNHENVRYCHRGETSNQRGTLALERFLFFFSKRKADRGDSKCFPVPTKSQDGVHITPVMCTNLFLFDRINIIGEVGRFTYLVINRISLYNNYIILVTK